MRVKVKRNELVVRVFFHSVFFLGDCKMGKNQSTTANWSTDDWAYGTGQNAVSIEEVLHETSKIPEKYFGGQAIQNDASMHQMQRDLLSFDETLINLFRRKKPKQSRNNIPTEDGYYYYEEQQSDASAQPMDLEQNQNYFQPLYANGNELSTPIPGINSSDKLFWRCTNCTAENKKIQRVCRRCGQAETRL